MPSKTAETAPTQRDRHLQFIAKHGRAAWQKASGYTICARAENLFLKLKDWSRIALRRDKMRQSWMGFAHLTATLINLRGNQFSHRP